MRSPVRTVAGRRGCRRLHRKPRHPTRAAVNAFHRELLGFLTGFEKRFAKWQAANPALDDEGKAALMQALYLTADGLIEELDDR